MNGLALALVSAVLFRVILAQPQQQQGQQLPKLYIEGVDLSRLPLVYVHLGNVSCPNDFYGVIAALQFFSYNSVHHFEYYANFTCSEIESDQITLTILVEDTDLAYFPQQNVIYIEYAIIYAWLAEFENTGWTDSKINAYLNFNYPDPFSRPKRFFYSKKPKFECESEQVTFDVIDFPVVLQNSGRTGVLVTFPNFTNPELQAETELGARISVLVTIYLHENCLPESVVHYCSIFHAVRAGSDDESTPQLFLTQFFNEIVLQVVDYQDHNTISSYPTRIFLKPGLVYQILLSVDIYSYQITVTSWDSEKPAFEEPRIETRELSFDQNIHVNTFNWPVSYIVFGGSDSFRSFEGFIDSATVFRSYFVYSDQSDVVSRRKLSELGQLLVLRLKQCHEIKIEASTCSAPNYLPGKWRREGGNVSGEGVYLEALDMLEKGRQFQEIIDKFDFAACLGWGQAEFLLGVLRQSMLYYLKASLMGEHFGDLALGNILMRQNNYRIAFLYLKSAADVSQKLTAQHPSNERWVDSIHLNDKDELLTHQDNDNGPVISWLMYQAGMGDAEAMHDVARLFYLGAQGLDRDMQRAAELFRRAAHMDADAEILYDYAVVLLHGRGVDQNRTLALKYLERAAARNYGPAYGALGWYYMEKEGGNLTRAVPYLEKAAELNVPEAAHNIGWLLLNNLHPFKPGRQPGLAYGYFVKAAGLGSLEGALMASEFAARGIPSIGLDQNATEACRYANAVATQSPRLGKPLREALSSYLTGDMRKSFIHYLIAAETGNDVALFNAGYLCETETSSLIKSGTFSTNDEANSCSKSMYGNVTSRPFIAVTNGPLHALLWLANEAANQGDNDRAAILFADALLGGADEGYYGLAWLAADRGYHIPANIFYKLILSDTDHSMSHRLASLEPVDVALFLLDACLTVEYKEDEEDDYDDGYLNIEGKMKKMSEGYWACALYKFYIKTNQTLRSFDHLALFLSGKQGFALADSLSQLWSHFHNTTGLAAFFIVGFVIGVFGVFPLVAFISSKLASIFRS